jgi:hypothetical protein
MGRRWKVDDRESGKGEDWMGRGRKEDEREVMGG